MIVCPACGRPTETGWTTCLNCGKALRPGNVQPGAALPPREMPVQSPVQQPNYQQQQQPYEYQKPPQYKAPQKGCFGKFVLYLLLAVFVWWLFANFIPAMQDLHLLFDNPYTTPHDVGVWFQRLVPFFLR